MVLLRTQLWSWALAGAVLCAVGWLALPGDCVVVPAGSSGRFLSKSILGRLLNPFSFDEAYAIYGFLTLTPLVIVILAMLHWWRSFEKIRAATAFYAMILSAAVAFHPFRSFSDAQLIAFIGVWGIVILLAYQSKASPGSALLALMSIQVVMSELYSGLGPHRGLPFWLLALSQSIVCCYGIFHYTRILRHGVLGRFTVIRPLDPADLARRRALAEEFKRLEGRG